ncbi:MAG: LptE family protein [Flavobacteriales bacterium]|nr:LptE family protein [Flavobacteriales bacterium]
MNVSFTGADVGNARTFSVDYLEPRAPQATPTAAQTVTETVRDLILAQSPLKLVADGADVRYEGQITGFDVQPVAIQANETAALNRLTITLSIRYTDTLEKGKDSEFTITRFADYDSGQDLVTVEETLVKEIGRQLAQDIFDRTLGRW